MSQLLNFLLQNSELLDGQSHQIQQKNQSQKRHNFRIVHVVYELLDKGKMPLLETIVKKLQQEEKVRQEKAARGKVNDEKQSHQHNPKQQFTFTYLITHLNLQECLEYLLQRGDFQQTQQNQQQNQKSSITSKDLQVIGFEKIIGVLRLFSEYVFVERRIGREEAEVLGQVVHYIKENSQSKNDDFRLLIQRCSMIINLATQSTSPIKQTFNDKISQAQQKQYVSSLQKPLCLQFRIKTISNTQTHISLCSLYKSALEIPSIQTLKVFHRSLPSIIQIHDSLTQKQFIDQINQLFEEFRKEYREQQQGQQTSEEEQSYAQRKLLEGSHKESIKYIMNQQLICYVLNTFSNLQSLKQLQQTLLECQQKVVQFLNSLYHLLQHCLKSELKNNLYLSPASCKQYVYDLLILSQLWSQSDLHKILSNNMTHGKLQSHEFSKDLQHQIGKAENIIRKIAMFLDYENTGVQNRLLSQEEYQTKVLPVMTDLAIDQQPRQQFQRLFVYSDKQHNILPIQTNNNATNKAQPSKYSPFVTSSIKKLESILSSNILSKENNNPTSLQTLLKLILLLPETQLSEQQLQELQQTFLNSLFPQFNTPTFNNQLLTFNYIYGEMKHVHFYQNHHFSHILVELYQTVFNQCMRHYQEQVKIYGQNAVSSSKLTFLTSIFDYLRNYLGRYGKNHLVQPNSKPFYQYLNLFKLCYTTFTKDFLYIISIDQLILLYDLILTQIIVKENHPLIRQYIEIVMARTYFVIKERTLLAHDSKQSLPNKFYELRNRTINMLEFDQQNLHNLNIAIPILMILGYELVVFLQSSSYKSNQTTSQESKQMISSESHEQDLKDQFSQLQIKPFHQLDIHYILVKYISCHVAYMRTISQYYLGKYLKLSQKKDQMLSNLVKFWYDDKDSFKIMTNIAVAVEGFDRQMQLFDQKTKFESFYMSFERVQEQPSQTTLYCLNYDTKIAFQRLISSKICQQNYGIKLILSQRINQLNTKMRSFEEAQIEKMIEQANKKPTEQPKKVQPKLKTSSNRKIKHPNQNRKGQDKQKKPAKVEQKEKQPIQLQNQGQTLTKQLTKQHYLTSLQSIISTFYQQCQKLNQPSIIIIATLLQKVHNFGYLVRTLTNHNAMLVVPSAQPFTHPECIELLPPKETIDVKVIEIRPKHLQSFIKMYKTRGYPLVALEQCSTSVELEKAVFPDKYMLLLGNQRIGAPASLLTLADLLVEIPQVGKIRSLNVHVSMVICFWEYLKQKENTNTKNQSISKQLKQIQA